MLRLEKYGNFLYPTAISIGALVLRLLFLGNHSLWLDEAYSFDVSTSGVAQILGNTKDPHPPLYYLLLHFWLSWGRSEVMLRFPSAILGTLSVPLAYALARLWSTKRVAYLAALLLALSPLHIWYSQEARMYSLLTFLGLVSALSLSVFLKRGKPIWWLAYVVSTLAGLYTHYGMLVLLLGENLWLAAWWATRESKPRFVIPWLSSQVALALGFLPWLPALMDNVSGQAGLQSFIAQQWGLLWKAGLAVPLAGAFVSLLVLAAGAFLWLKRAGSAAQQREMGLRLTAFVLYPLLTTASGFPQGLSVKRQLVVFLPYFFILAAAGLEKAPRARNLVAVSMVLLASVSLVSSYMQRQREDWRGAASLVQAEGQTGDVALFHAGYTIAPFDYYYRGTIPREGVVSQELDRQLASIQASYQRAWVILNHDAYEDPEGRLRRWLAEHWALQQEWTFSGIEVRLYSTEGRPTVSGQAKSHFVLEPIPKVITEAAYE